MLKLRTEILVRIMFFTFIMLFFILINPVSANSITSIDMDVYIDNHGNASVTEVWKATLTKGTEGYRPYTDIGKSEISSFSVTDQTGTTYQSLDTWRTNETFEAKAYKSGIKTSTDGVELCWGISNYGNNTYILKYNISNFVTQYKDTQGIYSNLLKVDQRISRVKITIHSDYKFSLNNAKIWALGNDGTINFVDGKIVLDSVRELSSTQYMVALVRFESNLFNITNYSDKSFDDIYDLAMSDVRDSLSDIYNSLMMRTDNPIIQILIAVTYIFIWYVFIFLGCKILKCLTRPIIKIVSHVIKLITKIVFYDIPYWILGEKYNKIKNMLSDWFERKKNNKIKTMVSKLNFGGKGKIIPPYNEIEYWREIPCNKDLNRAYWVSYQYNVVSAKTLKNGIIGAILLRWVKDGKITVSKTRAGLFSFKDNNYAIDLSNMTETNNDIDYSLLGILEDAAGENSILEAKEFEKWCKKNYFRVDSWFMNFLEREQGDLKKQGLITTTTEETETQIITNYNVNDELYNDAIRLKGLIKFLLDYSLISEREYFQVHLWEEYLIFAQLLGIADKVEEQFSKLYPQFKEESSLNSNMTIAAVMGMVGSGLKGTEDGRQENDKRRASHRTSRHDYSGRDRDSGGGGKSYRTGGSSAGGSSGGGFR